MNPEAIYQNLSDEDKHLLDRLLTDPPPREISWSKTLDFLQNRLPKAIEDEKIIVRDGGARLTIMFRNSSKRRLSLGHRADGQFISKYNIELIQDFLIFFGFKLKR
ncbi:MAG: hypothetical protein AAF289_01345 [Cyanobacteria bacterium P01_A01_bin.135]